MKLFYDIFPQETPCCVALGFFDGMHTGHRRLMLSMKKYAAENDLLPCVFTFSDSPCALLGKAESRALQTFKQRIAAVEEFSGAEKCFAVDFEKYRDVAAVEFVEDILIGKLNARAVFCGFNFRFGKNAQGSTELLSDICKRHGVSAFVIEPVCADGETVSSTKLRRLIREGKVAAANELLAHPLCIDGEIIHGRENGRKVGIPTVNQDLPEDFIVPRFGVYASRVTVDGKKYRSITNIGTRPTVNGSGVNCETHILEEIGGELYGKSVSTELLGFVRDERRFDSLEQLAEQIKLDIAYINRGLENGCYS